MKGLPACSMMLMMLIFFSTTFMYPVLRDGVKVDNLSTCRLCEATNYNTADLILYLHAQVIVCFVYAMCSLTVQSSYDKRSLFSWACKTYPSIFVVITCISFYVCTILLFLEGSKFWMCSSFSSVYGSAVLCMCFLHNIFAVSIPIACIEMNVCR
ncbi:MAG TPA: hypothetical protein VLE02_01535 [Nitrosarchaeum sp.]|nr:hypothetical protein [Nitrosarchaeum sp.]